MIRKLLFLPFSLLVLPVLSQNISGPAEVPLNTTITYININGPGYPGYIEFYWIVDSATIISQSQDSICCTWSQNGFYDVELWIDYIYAGGEELLEKIEVVAGDPPIIEYSYDNSGNRISREIIYYSELDSGLKSFKVPPILEEESKEETIRLYPNPASHSINILLSDDILENENRMIQIYDLQGRLMLQEQPNGNLNEVNISALKFGNYIVRLVYGKNVNTWKLIKH